jgi:hypothetical protein
MKRSVINALSFYLSSVLAGFLCLSLLTFPNVGNAATYEELWRYAINNSTHRDWCARTFNCVQRPKVVFSANLDPKNLGETFFDDPDTVYVRQFLDPSLAKAVIVHEFVHALQLRRGTLRPDVCSVLGGEREAWRVGLKYAASVGIWHPKPDHALIPLANQCEREKK